LPAAAAGFATSFATPFISRATSLASVVKRSNSDWPNPVIESLCCDWDLENTDDIDIVRDRVGVEVPDDLSIDVEGDIGRCGRSEEKARGVELRLWSEPSEPTDSIGLRPDFNRL
jgi:hypothetical protein